MIQEQAAAGATIALISDMSWTSQGKRKKKDSV